jgi:hypothetical protein
MSEEVKDLKSLSEKELLIEILEELRNLSKLSEVVMYSRDRSGYPYAYLNTKNKGPKEFG